MFRAVRNDPAAVLFGFDQYGQVYIHQSTHNSVRRVWEQLLVTGQRAVSRPAPLGMNLPHLGPSEDIAGHQPADPRPGNPGVQCPEP